MLGGPGPKDVRKGLELHLHLELGISDASFPSPWSPCVWNSLACSIGEPVHIACETNGRTHRLLSSRAVIDVFDLTYWRHAWARGQINTEIMDRIENFDKIGNRQPKSGTLM